MDWESLRPVIVGGLIATLPIVISNFVQIHLKRMDIKQKERESRIELELELTRNRIQIIEDSIDDSLKVLSNLKMLRYQLLTGQIDHVEMENKVESLINDSESKPYKSEESSVIADKYATTMGKEFLSEYKNFDDLWNAYAGLVRIPTFTDGKSLEELYQRMINSAGKLRTLLDEKLISIRDS